jgi:hypothetical protein
MQVTIDVIKRYRLDVPDEHAQDEETAESWALEQTSLYIAGHGSLMVVETANPIVDDGGIGRDSEEGVTDAT